MSHYLVHPASGPLSGRVQVPGDKSIGHRAILFGALADGLEPSNESESVLIAAISVKGVPSFTVAEALWNVQQALNA